MFFFYFLSSVRNRRNKGKEAEITESGAEIGSDNLTLALNEDDKKDADQQKQDDKQAKAIA